MLVDRRWPPGLTRDEVNADLWLKDVAPSEDLLRCGAARERCADFTARYRAELERNTDLRVLADLHARGPITLLHCGAPQAGNAAVVKELLEALCERVGEP